MQRCYAWYCLYRANKKRLNLYGGAMLINNYKYGNTDVYGIYQIREYSTDVVFLFLRARVA